MAAAQSAMAEKARTPPLGVVDPFNNAQPMSGQGGGLGAPPMTAGPMSIGRSNLLGEDSVAWGGGTIINPMLATALAAGGPPSPPPRGQPVANPVVGGAPTVLQVCAVEFRSPSDITCWRGVQVR